MARPGRCCTESQHSAVFGAELASLRPSSFCFGTHPTVRVESAYTKNGDPATLPLNAALVPLVRAWLPTEGDELLFPGLESKKTWLLVRKDLKAAGLPLRTACGIRNFHAIRNSFISMLLEGGTDPKTVQMLARHSDINLTLSYARPPRDSDVRAINGLRLPGPTEQQAKGKRRKGSGEGDAA